MDVIEKIFKAMGLISKWKTINEYIYPAVFIIIAIFVFFAILIYLNRRRIKALEREKGNPQTPVGVVNMYIDKAQMAVTSQLADLTPNALTEGTTGNKNESTTTCPHCKKQIKKQLGHNTCQHCGHSFSFLILYAEHTCSHCNKKVTIAPGDKYCQCGALLKIPKDQKYYCAKCGHYVEIHPSDTTCPSCDFQFRDVPETTPKKRKRNIHNLDDLSYDDDDYDF